MNRISQLVIATLLSAAATLNAQTRYLFTFGDKGYVNSYAIDNNHTKVGQVQVMSGGNTRGMAVSQANASLYCFYNIGSGTALRGRIARVDISNPLAPRKVWDVVGNTAGVDRGDVSHDGKKLFVPTFESNKTQAYERVLNALTGANFDPNRTIPSPIQSHNTCVSLNGTLVWMENKAGGVIKIDPNPYDLTKIDGRIRAANSVTEQVTYVSPRFLNQGRYANSKESGTVQPFAVTSSNQYIYACVKGTYGFQWVNRGDGIVRAHNFTDKAYDGDTSYVSVHGIALKPDETEVWTVDNGNTSNFVHVTDITDPSNPVDKTRPGGGARVVLGMPRSHWITFSILGDYAYVGGPKNSRTYPAEVINTATYARVATLGPTGCMVEVDYQNGAISAVGSQFGLGRK